MIPTPAEAALAARIAEAREPVLVKGAGTKEGMLRPVQAAATISTVNMSGITLYAPKELIISAQAGTPLGEVEAALARHGQHLIAEPRNFPGQTLGGAVATNLSGPRRVAWGAMRDHVMGVRAVTGRGEVIHSGGRVLKNVTGLDLCKLLTGSHGTLAVITEVTLKVLPMPEASGTIVIDDQDADAAVRTLSAALGSPYGVSAAAWLPGAPTKTLIRIEDFSTSVKYRTEKLRAELGHPNASILGGAASRDIWRDVRDVTPLPAASAIWRVSVRPSLGPAVLKAVPDTEGFLDWGGGLVWLAGDANETTHRAVEAAARDAGGTWMLMKAPDSLRNAVDVLPPEPAVLAAITRRVKQAMDPRGILNPGRMYAGI